MARQQGRGCRRPGAKAPGYFRKRERAFEEQRARGTSRRVPTAGHHDRPFDTPAR